MRIQGAEVNSMVYGKINSYKLFIVVSSTTQKVKVLRASQKDPKVAQV